MIPICTRQKMKFTKNFRLVANMTVPGKLKRQNRITAININLNRDQGQFDLGPFYTLIKFRNKPIQCHP